MRPLTPKSICDIWSKCFSAADGLQPFYQTKKKKKKQKPQGSVYNLKLRKSWLIIALQEPHL